MRIIWKGTHAIVASYRVVRLLGRVVSLGNGALAITFWPFIFVRPDQLHFDELIRHETIHIRQQLELLLVGSWLLYLVEYTYARYGKKLDKRQAYYYTALEQEAHRNAHYVDYLQRRKPYAVLRYITDKKWLGRTATGELLMNDYS